MADGREEIRLSAARGLELNYCMPPDSPEVGRRVESWFVAAVDAFAGEYVREFPVGGLPSAGLRDRAGGPFGPVGSRWCSLLVLEKRDRKVGQEQSVMDSYGGIGGGVLLNRRNEVGR